MIQVATFYGNIRLIYCERTYTALEHRSINNRYNLPVPQLLFITFLLDSNTLYGQYLNYCRIYESATE